MVAKSILERLSGLGLVIVTGKGGVGKSCISAALGRLLSDAGEQVLLIEVDPRENLHHLLDVPPSGGEMVEVSPRLRIQHLAPRSIIDDLVREKLKVKMLVNRVLASPIHQQFTEAAPGLKEAAVFGRALRLLEGHNLPRRVPRPTTIVLDAPASGHGVTWLAAPQLIADVISAGPIGSMARTVAAFLEDRRKSGVVLVTTGEEMPVHETLELIESMRRRLGRSPEVVVANALYPEPVDADVADNPITRLWLDRRSINDEELTRLGELWDGPITSVPLFALDPGPPLVGRIARTLLDDLGSPL
jgi:anion-transporting  ArsA/GET3 family ATPase